MAITQQALDFLFENRLHDSRDWFLAHRAEYEALVKRPAEELAAALAPAALAVDPLLATQPSRAVSRIRRDTRFTRDKSLYRDRVWIAFARPNPAEERRAREELPCFYLEFSSDGSCGWGCGFYAPSPAYLETLRAQVRARTPSWQAAAAALAAHPQLVLDGTRYKRPRFADAPADERPWLELRSLFVHRVHPAPQLLFSDRLAAAAGADFAALAPLYDFLLEVWSLRRAELVFPPALQ